jgi:hypothetical protein
VVSKTATPVRFLGPRSARPGDFHAEAPDLRAFSRKPKLRLKPLQTAGNGSALQRIGLRRTRPIRSRAERSANCRSRRSLSVGFSLSACERRLVDGSWVGSLSADDNRCIRIHARFHAHLGDCDQQVAKEGAGFQVESSPLRLDHRLIIFIPARFGWSGESPGRPRAEGADALARTRDLAGELIR